MVWSDKTTYVGEWFEDERCGEGEMRYNTGEVFAGKWKNDRQEGAGRLDYVNGDSLKVSQSCATIHRIYWRAKIQFRREDT